MCIPLAKSFEAGTVVSGGGAKEDELKWRSCKVAKREDFDNTIFLKMIYLALVLFID